MALIPRVLGAAPLLFAGPGLLVVTLALLTTDRGKGNVMFVGADSDLAEAWRLEARSWAYVRRLERKERVTRALLAGRLSLLEAAAYFRALNHGSPEFYWEGFRTRIPGATDDERHCNSVIDSACLSVSRRDRARAEEVDRRLRAELAEHLRRGPLCLPELPWPLDCLDGDPD
jgi:hypothetical protein